jgi:hypothetical protein
MRKLYPYLFIVELQGDNFSEGEVVTPHHNFSIYYDAFPDVS